MSLVYIDEEVLVQLSIFADSQGQDHQGITGLLSIRLLIESDQVFLLMLTPFAPYERCYSL